jgi:hypothetical protein
MRRSGAARSAYAQGLGTVSARERRLADLFYDDLMGRPRRRRRGVSEEFPPLEPGFEAAPDAWPEVSYAEASYYPEAGYTETSYPEASYPEVETAYPVIEVTPESSLTVPEDTGLTEVVPLGGKGAFRHDPLGGDPGDNVQVRFNVDASGLTGGSAVDVVVHLHGYGSPGAGFLARKATLAGVDLLDATGTVKVRASRPTLVLVPRGRNTSGNRWVFDTLPSTAAFDALVDAGLTWLSRTLGLTASAGLTRGRLTLMAHSGGGAALSGLLAHGVNPDEVVCFDSLYGLEDPVARWMEARVPTPAGTRCGLRAFYTRCGPGSWTWSGSRWILQSTEVSARRLHHRIGAALAAAGPAGAALATRYRVEVTSVGHNDIPARYSPLLLDDMAATVPGAGAPPAPASKPPCVANTDWLDKPARRPGGEAPPAAAPKTEMEDEAVYSATDARAYTPSASATLFRTAPRPVAVDAATQWPEATTSADGAAERALRALGVKDAGIRAYAGPGFTALRPVAAAFGEAALTELLRRLRYSAAWLTTPKHSYNKDSDLNAAFGKTVKLQVLLALRVLLAIPGHFRELARRAGTEPEAFALENLGWLLMQALGAEVRTASTLDFWLPSSPAFVTRFANPLPALSPQVNALITARSFLDPSLNVAQYTACYEAWRTGVPGRLWRLETGRETSPGRVAGAPFYSEPFTIPASINFSGPKAQIDAAWARRTAAFDAGKVKTPLTDCDNSYLNGLGLHSAMSLGGLQLRAKFPSPSGAAALTSLTGLTAVKPAFEAAFKAVADAGWNDLLFETQGMGCFRGKKVDGNLVIAHQLSNHGVGTAVDLNAFENGQHNSGSMDPRIVALFEAFRFNWGRAFSTPDPMHFEYAG